jgi:uncharacterized RmlC-like cupin family protein
MTTSVADSVRVVSPGRTHVGKQGFTYGSGASAETVGARQVCMNVLPMPDGARAKVHYHKASRRSPTYLAVNASCITVTIWSTTSRRTLETKSSFRRTSLTLLAIKAAHLVHG